MTLSGDQVHLSNFVLDHHVLITIKVAFDLELTFTKRDELLCHICLLPITSSNMGTYFTFVYILLFITECAFLLQHELYFRCHKILLSLLHLALDSIQRSIRGIYSCACIAWSERKP